MNPKLTRADIEKIREAVTALEQIEAMEVSADTIPMSRKGIASIDATLEECRVTLGDGNAQLRTRIDNTRAYFARLLKDSADAMQTPPPKRRLEIHYKHPAISTSVSDAATAMNMHRPNWITSGHMDSDNSGQVDPGAVSSVLAKIEEQMDRINIAHDAPIVMDVEHNLLLALLVGDENVHKDFINVLNAISREWPNRRIVWYGFPTALGTQWDLRYTEMMVRIMVDARIDIVAPSAYFTGQPNEGRRFSLLLERGVTFARQQQCGLWVAVHERFRKDAPPELASRLVPHDLYRGRIIAIQQREEVTGILSWRGDAGWTGKAFFRNILEQERGHRTYQEWVDGNSIRELGRLNKHVERIAADSAGSMPRDVTP